ncbi:MAG: choice-of-anchor J domain-containing protein [Clostridia bacterium]|nr:choice-of-anchor J domain-containing protein [Clostridia bacterium]
MTKRIVGILVAVLMVMALIPMSVFADTAVKNGVAPDGRIEAPRSTRDVALAFDFEGAEGEPTDWTFIDDDGDGYNWDWQGDYSETPHMTAYSGEGLIFSASYDNDAGIALTPDNWAITPAIELPEDVNTLSFWVAGQDANYAAEHYAVYAGTSADISAMQSIMPEAIATGTYTKKTIDISPYAGETMYFAIRHFNVTDMFFLNIDLVEINAGAVAPVEEPAMGNYFESEEEFGEWTLVDLDGDSYNWALDLSGLAYEGEGCAYSRSWFSGTYKTALTPDNWMISPAIEVPLLNARVTFWAANSSSYYMDTMAVYILTAPEADADAEPVIEAFEPPTTYTEYEIDLADYAGETIYIAFRHFDCTDMMRLYVDQFEVWGTNEEPLNDLDRALNVEGGRIHFENDANYPWVVMTEGNREYAQSGNGGSASTSSTITATVTAEEGDIVQYDFKAWGEGSSTYWDHCDFSIDGSRVLYYGAYDNDWELFFYELTAGEHTLVWTYTKDSSVNPSGDYFAVDNVYVGQPVLAEEIVADEAIEVPVNRAVQINWEVLPAAAQYKDVIFTVDDPSIATVSTTGSVFGVSEGETFVTITLESDPSVYTVVEVNVIDTGLTASLIYAICCYDFGGTYDDQWINFTDVDPATVNALGSAPSAYAGTYAYGNVYGMTTSGDFYFAPIDNLQNMTTFSGVYTANTVTSMTFDYTRGCLFAIAAGDDYSYLVAIDPSNGMVTEIGTLSDHLFGLCVDEEGNGYGIDGNGNLVSVDLDTAVYTTIGSTGVSVNYVQDICYDFNTGDIYWGQIYSASSASLYRVNKETGAVENLGTVSGGMELVSMFVIPNEEPEPADDVPVESITITPEEVEVRVGETVQLTALVRPFNATNKNVEWAVEDEDIAAVDQNGLVIGIAEGTTMVYATTEDGGLTAYAIVNVIPGLGENVAGFFFETSPAGEGWQFIDQDGDGFNWVWNVDQGWTGFNIYEGQGIICSQSYDNGTYSALSPDNWAISPAIEAPAGFVSVTLQAVGQDPSYAAEHFAIYAGTSPDPASMEMISNEFVVGGEYAEYSGSIADFEGGTLYIAIRHFNVTDMFILNVDAVEVWVNEGGDTPPEPPVEPLWGDADGDGDVDSVDVLLAMRYVQGLDEIEEDNLPWVDVNGDGEVTMADALLILRKVMSIIDAFPVEE